MTTPRVIAVNRYYAPDNSATAQLLAELAEALATRGTPVTVFTSRLRYNDPHARLPRRERRHGVDVRRVWTSRFGRDTLLGRAIDFLTFYLTVSIAVLGAARRGDTLLAETDPPLLSIPLALLARWKGARLVNWCQDLYPEVAVALGIRWARGPLGHALIAARNWSLRQAAMNVVLCDRMHQYLAQQGVPPASLRLVHNWASDTIRPLPRPPMAETTITYSGNLGRAHRLDAILDLIRRTRDIPSLVYRFVSAGPGAEALERQCRAHGFHHVKFSAPTPLHALSESLARADLHLVSLDPACEGLIMPSKVYGVMAAGRPTVFLGSPEGAVARLLARHDAGFTVDIDAPEAYLVAISGMIGDPARLAAMGENARRAFETHYSAAHSLNAWASVLAGDASPVSVGCERLAV